MATSERRRIYLRADVRFFALREASIKRSQRCNALHETIQKLSLHLLSNLTTQGENNMKLSEKIVTLRKQKGWSQEELADKLNVSRQAVGKWETETALPEVDKILQMATLFEVSTDCLLKDDMSLPTQQAPAAQNTSAKRKSARVKKIGSLFNSIIWLIAVAVYFTWSFLSGAWGISWVVFVATAILTAIGNVIIDLLCVNDDGDEDKSEE